MPRKRQTSAEKQPHARKPTPTFLLELPLQVTAGQAKRLRAHLEAARQLYNAVLSEGQRRLRRMRADPAWQAARAIPRTQKLGTTARLWSAATAVRVLGVRAARRGQRLELCLDRRPRRCRAGADAGHPGLSRPQPGVSGPGAPGALQEPGTGPLQRGEQAQRYRAALRARSRPKQGNAGYLLWQDDRLPATHRLEGPGGDLRPAPPHQICPPHPAPGEQCPRRGGRSQRASATSCNWRSKVSRITSPNTRSASDTVGLDLGPSTIAIVPREGTPRLELLCAELAPDAQAIRRLQRQMDRQRRANNPDQLR